VSLPISSTRSADLSTFDLYQSADRVIGQERARRQLAVLLRRQLEVAQGRWEKSESAIIGGFTGVGKSMMARIMCEACGLPFADVNATQFTETGYAGDDLSQMFLPLIESAAQMYYKRLRMDPPNVASVLKYSNIDTIAEKASTGVILMDEFDKWMQRINHHTGRLDTAIQAELLKMIEGSVVYVSDNEDEAGIPFDTSKVMILCAGAFVGLAEQVRRRLEQPREAVINEAFWQLIEQSDFIRFGVIPELAGRLSKMVFLRPLLKDHLAVIISQPNGPIDELKQRFSDLNCEWRVPPEAIGHLADIALRRDVGARGIDSVLWTAFSDALFQASVSEYPTVVRLAVNQIRAEVVAA
jgi:ATP-dependent Clp protease ATP-binding subunit ClpX